MPPALTETLLLLLAAHLLADFALQPRRLLRRKHEPAFLLAHVGIVTGVTALLLGGGPPGLLVVLALAHLVMDAVKVHALPDTLWAFLTDQLVHLAALAGVAAVWPEAAANGLWRGLLDGPGWLQWLQAWMLITGLLLALPVGGVVIELALRPLTGALGSDDGPERGLPGGGRLIGWGERGLVFVLFLTGAQTAIGFAIAAKSILRFGEISDSRHRRLAEYILIGTFASFAWGLAAAWLTRHGLGIWAA